ncbi:MAG TPA: flagellar biosynthesis protein FlgA, partial [Firmicutes bacterium]|nr:flagellar biosynthesis protein FlgA [Bacillota bacterium]
MVKYKIGKGRFIGEGAPVYIIAEIGSNFDRSLVKAKEMIDLAKSVGADVAKFQSFQAEKIVSAEGFKNLKISFQSKWKKSVFQVYRDAEFPRAWHKQIVDYCRKQKIDFMTAPYDHAAVDLMEELDLPLFKIGSGEIDNLDFLRYIAGKGKPILLSVGASSLGEIDRAVETIVKSGNDKLILMQCITNYPSPFEDANIRVLESLKSTFGFPVGYSDHTPG